MEREKHLYKLNHKINQLVLIHRFTMVVGDEETDVITLIEKKKQCKLQQCA